MSKNMDEKIINCIRALSMDAIQKANSGHPGITMGAAPMAYKLFKISVSFNFHKHASF